MFLIIPGTHFTNCCGCQPVVHFTNLWLCVSHITLRLLVEHMVTFYCSADIDTNRYCIKVLATYDGLGYLLDAVEEDDDDGSAAVAAGGGVGGVDGGGGGAGSGGGDGSSDVDDVKQRSSKSPVRGDVHTLVRRLVLRQGVSELAHPNSELFHIVGLRMVLASLRSLDSLVAMEAHFGLTAGLLRLQDDARHEGERIQTHLYPVHD
jgi:hypothetical protein